MEVAVITDEIDSDPERAAAVMSDCGVRVAELRQIWDKNIVDAPVKYWRRAKDIFARQGITVAGIASPFYKCDLPGDPSHTPAGRLHNAEVRGLDGQADVLARAIEAAHFFDASLVRVFSFWRRGEMTPEVEDTIVDAFREPAATAASAGIVLGIENEGACYIGTGEQLGRVLRRIDSDSVKAIWDPGNAFLDGDEPYPRGYHAVSDLIAHVHVKDYRMAPGKKSPEWAVVGEGDIDYLGQLSALKKSGYAGYLSLETHYEGSWSKEAASRLCLEKLIDLVGNQE
ncbi:MAG: Sugar phosphate isomerase/epimerase [Capsulimonas sp.]|nr:Sugar phosphate isomerase/epimerase [Capsulimonas sp.]